MDIQMILFNAEDKKTRKVVKVKLEDLPSNEELISPPPAKEFVHDILIRGQLEPIQLNKTPKGFYVISGRRRIKAFRELQQVEPERFATIDAFIYGTEEITAILAASAHNNRKADNPMVDLEAIQIVMASNPKASKAEISRMTGIPIPRIGKRLRLLDLQPGLQQGLKDGNITVATAEKAATLPANLQDKLVEKMTENKGKLSLDHVIEVQRVRVQDTAKNLVLPGITPIQSTSNNTVLGYVLVDLEFNNILGGILQEKDIKNNLEQYKKDYPEIKLEVYKLVKHG